MKKIKLNDIRSLAHTQWNCKYHIVFAPKNRRKIRTAISLSSNVIITKGDGSTNNPYQVNLS